MRAQPKGFTLVELAIVLVIIGLIVGGVLVGRDLIRTAELRNVLADIEKYQAAVNTFRNKYNALPGDMRNAQDFWGVANATPNLCETAISGPGPTCNGDGNKMIDKPDHLQEYELQWHHLNNANLINHSVTTIATDGSEYMRDKTFDFIYYVIFVGNIPAPGDSDLFGGNYGHALFSMHAADFASFNIFSPEEAYWLDEKKDDGKPGTGILITTKNGSSLTTNPCSTTDDATTSEYMLATTTPDCPVFFLRLF